MIFALFFFTAYSITFFLMQKVVWLHHRHPLADALLNCTYCTGFWASLLSLALTRPVDQLSWTWDSISMVIALAFSGALFCYMMDIGMGLVEQNLESEE